MLSITKLPDLCILALFDKLPVQDLVRIDKVFPSLRKLKFIALHRRKSLVFVDDEDFFLRPTFIIPCHNQLAIGTKSTDYFALSWGYLRKPHQLLNPFPTVTNLTIKLCGIEMAKYIGRLCDLIDQWSTTLISLKLALAFSEDSGSVVPLIDSINRLKSLKVLELDFHQLMIIDEKIDLSVLARLEQFYFRSYNDDEILFDSLKQYAEPNGNIQRVGLNFVSGDAWKYMNKMSPEFASRFTHLNMTGEIPAFNLIDFTTHFPSLVDISTFDICSLDPVNVSVGELARHLSPLRQLTCLRMEIDLLAARLSQKDLTRLSKLVTVKEIALSIWANAHSALETLYLEHVFPNVEVIEITYHSEDCLDCPNLNHTESEMKRCLLQRLRPLKQCAQLKRTVISVYSFHFGRWVDWNL